MIRGSGASILALVLRVCYQNLRPPLGQGMCTYGPYQQSSVNSHSRAAGPEIVFYILDTGQVFKYFPPQRVLQHSIHLWSMCCMSTKTACAA